MNAIQNDSLFIGVEYALEEGFPYSGVFIQRANGERVAAFGTGDIVGDFDTLQDWLVERPVEVPVIYSSGFLDFLGTHVGAYDFAPGDDGVMRITAKESARPIMAAGKRR